MASSGGWDSASRSSVRHLRCNCRSNIQHSRIPLDFLPSPRQGFVFSQNVLVFFPSVTAVIEPNSSSHPLPPPHHPPNTAPIHQKKHGVKACVKILRNEVCRETRAELLSRGENDLRAQNLFLFLRPALLLPCSPACQPVSASQPLSQRPACSLAGASHLPTLSTSSCSSFTATSSHCPLLGCSLSPLLLFAFFLARGNVYFFNTAFSLHVVTIYLLYIHVCMKQQTRTIYLYILTLFRFPP